MKPTDRKGDRWLPGAVPIRFLTSVRASVKSLPPGNATASELVGAWDTAVNEVILPYAQAVASIR